MDDLTTIVSALSEAGTVGILIAFVWVIWRAYQLLSERLYNITMILMRVVIKSHHAVETASDETEMM